MTAQYETLEKDHGKWRFTSPTYVVAAFDEALRELKAEGGIAARHARYAAVNEALREGMAELGFKAYVAADRQGPFITTFLYPDQAGFDFKHMYAVLKAGGYVIYPGKLTERPSFRLGNIGEIHSDDVPKILGLFRGYLASL